MSWELNDSNKDVLFSMFNSCSDLQQYLFFVLKRGKISTDRIADMQFRINLMQSSLDILKKGNN